MIRDARILDLATGTAQPATDLHIRAGRISRTPVVADEIDAEGRLVIPGLWDAHVHMAQWALCSRWRDVSTATSAAHAATLIGDMLTDKDATSDEIVVGFGFRDSRWPDRPDRAVLDQATGNVPVLLLSGDMHSAWANTAGLAQLGMAGRDGHLVEEDAFEATRRINQLPDAVLDRRIAEAACAAAARGVVGIMDFDMRWGFPEWQRRFAAGFNTLCVRPAIYPAWLDRAIAEGLHTGDRLDESGLLTVGAMKVISDGSLTARTAHCCEPYLDAELGAADPERPRGMANLDQAELLDLMTRATSQGLECAIHAIGDQAVSDVLDAFIATGARGSIEHAQLVRPADLARWAGLEVRASVQPAHLLDDRATMDRVWADRADHAFPLAAMADAGITLALGSDAPVAPLNPWLGIQASVTRTTSGLPPWHPEQALSLSQALSASARGVTALVPGAEADLLLLEDNPFTVDPATLHTIGPWLTMVDGTITHQR